MPSYATRNPMCILNEFFMTDDENFFGFFYPAA